MNKNRRYSNGIITVIWQPAECIHSGACFGSLRKVFDPVKRPWINMEAGTTEEIITAVERCPSRALTFCWNDPERMIHGLEHSKKLIDAADIPALFPTDGSEDETTAAKSQPEPATKITFREGGPLVVEGSFTIVDKAGNLIQPKLKMASFCRCGMSENQPFCDGAHFKAGFRK